MIAAMQHRSAPNKGMAFDVRTVLARRDAGCNVSASVRMETHTPTALTTSEILVTKASAALDALNQLAAKLDSAIKNSPLSELEKNARQHFISQLANQGLVTREEFEVQVELLARARTKLNELESKIALLEADRGN